MWVFIKPHATFGFEYSWNIVAILINIPSKLWHVIQLFLGISAKILFNADWVKLFLVFLASRDLDEKGFEDYNNRMLDLANEFLPI